MIKEENENLTIKSNRKSWMMMVIMMKVDDERWWMKWFRKIIKIDASMMKLNINYLIVNDYESQENVKSVHVNLKMIWTKLVIII